MTTSTTTTITADRIEKRIHLRAPRARVWRALTDLREFNAWFGCKLEGRFAPGAMVSGTAGCNGKQGGPMQLTIERIEPQSLFSYRWHPFATDPQADYSGEPTTLVEFHLADADGGTRLTVIEAGFDALPEERRQQAYPKHDAGWQQQLVNIERHVAS